MQQEEQSSVHLSLKLSSVTSVIYQLNNQYSDSQQKGQGEYYKQARKLRRCDIHSLSNIILLFY